MNSRVSSGSSCRIRRVERNSWCASPPGKSAARGAGIGHEQRVADERGIADHVGHVRRRVAGRVHDPRADLAQPEPVAVVEQDVELAAVALEFAAGVEDLAEDVLDA